MNQVHYQNINNTTIHDNSRISLKKKQKYYFLMMIINNTNNIGVMIM
jgi:hypothetical protein